MSGQEPAYELMMSRIFHAPPSAVRRAFTDPEVRDEWVPTDGRPLPDLTSSAENGPLTWAEQHAPSGGAGDGPLGAARTVRVEMQDEAGGKTLLDLRAGPYSEAEEVEARAWWNRAFSHLDTVLEGNGR